MGRCGMWLFAVAVGATSFGPFARGAAPQDPPPESGGKAAAPGETAAPGAELPTPFGLCWTPAPALDSEQAVAAYRAAESAFREKLAQAIAPRIQLAVSDLEHSEEAKQTWVKAILATNPERIQLEMAAIQLFETTGDTNVLPLLFQTFNRAFENGRMGKVYRIAKLLAERSDSIPESLFTKENREAVKLRLGLTANYVGDLVHARAFADSFRHLAGEMGKDDIAVLNQLAYLEKSWVHEVSRLEADRDLPQVKLTTNLGEIVVELFEDDAPVTVNNFVFLVEAGFYDNTIFHAVIPRQVSQGGLYEPNRNPKLAGYNVPDEHALPTARGHFYGYLSMGRPDEPADSASSIFGILTCPMGGLDGRRTVFGRVISGMEIVEEFEPTQGRNKDDRLEELPGTNPTILVKAEVVRKRDHAYLGPGGRNRLR